MLTEELSNKDMLKELTVLYVEDDEYAIEGLKSILSRKVKTIYTATNGQEGLESYKKFPVDIVLTDIRMPIMDGIEMVREIKKINSNAKTIYISAHNEQDILMQAIDAGADGFVIKPISVRTKLMFILDKIAKEIEDVMLEGKAHLAVHSLKDVPTKSEEGLRLNAITKREDSRDAMLSEKYSSIDELPKGAVVGTTSLRRRMQLLAHRDDLTIKDLRGNVDTRINKLKNGEFDAIILASAGLNRLGLNDAVKYVTPIDKELMIPAMGQAALGIETPDNEEMAKIVSVLNDDTSNIETTIERDFIDALDGGCQVPIGINAELNGDSIDISAILGYPDGTNMLTKKVTINKSEYKQIGDKLAQEMIKDGAKEILAEAEKRAFK